MQQTSNQLSGKQHSSTPHSVDRSLRVYVLGTAIDHAVPRLARALETAGHHVRVRHEVHGLAEDLPLNQTDVVLAAFDPACHASRRLLRSVSTHGAGRPRLIVMGHRTGLPGLISALDEGADDYLLHDDGAEAALARINAHARRTPPCALPDAWLRLGRFSLAPSARAVMIDTPDGMRIAPLPAREFTLLQHLFENPGRVIARDTLMHLIWGEVDQRHVQTLSTYISKIRNALALRPKGGMVIATLYGVGYRLELHPGPRRSPIGPAGTAGPAMRGAMAFKRHDMHPDMR